LIFSEHTSQTILDYLNLHDWADTKSVIDSNTWLLEDDLTASHFARLVAANPEAGEYIRAKQRFLATCRRHGWYVISEMIRQLVEIEKSVNSVADEHHLEATLEYTTAGLALVEELGKRLEHDLRRGTIAALLMKWRASALLNCSLGEEDIEEAVVLLETAARIFEEKRGVAGPDDLKELESYSYGTQLELVRAYGTRRRGNPFANIQQARAYATAASTWHLKQPDPRNFAAVHMNLGGALIRMRSYGTAAQRYRWMTEAANSLVIAASAFDTLGRREDAANAKVQAALARRHNPECKVTQLRESACTVMSAIRVLQRAEPRWSNHLAAANAALVEICFDERLAHTRKNALRAARACERALELWSHKTHPYESAQLTLELSKCYAFLALFERDAHWAEKQFALWKKLESYLLNFPDPDLVAEAFRTELRFHFAIGNWPVVASVFERFSRRWISTYGSALTLEEQRYLATDLSKMGKCAAYSWLQLGNAVRAIQEMERCRAVMLTQALTLKEKLASLPEKAAGLARSMETLSQEITSLRLALKSGGNGARTAAHVRHLVNEIQSKSEQLTVLRARAGIGISLDAIPAEALFRCVPENGCLVIPIVSNRGTTVVFVPTGAERLDDTHALNLEVQESDIQQIVSSRNAQGDLTGISTDIEALSTKAATNTDLERVGKRLSAALSRLWELMMGRIHDRLLELGISPGAHVTFVAQGALNLLPLELSFRKVDGGTRYFLDDWCVSYVPGLAVATGNRPPGNKVPISMLVIADPTLDLQYAQSESQTVSGFAHGNCIVLAGANATKKDVQGQMQKHTHHHYACHGLYDRCEPDESALVLANEERLSVRDIMQSGGLAHVELAFLSACRTGIVDIECAPEEFLGLPAAFIGAGANNVIATRWSVASEAMQQLAACFYREHLEFGREVHVALRNAQQKVREKWITRKGREPCAHIFFWGCLSLWRK
jgi:CHAT domain-containing protein